jgi:hypothetical protein
MLSLPLLSLRRSPHAPSFHRRHRNPELAARLDAAINNKTKPLGSLGVHWKAWQSSSA